MNKQDLLSQLHDHLQQEIKATICAVNEAHALASHEQSKPENQYDTLALEAAYLAHGQSERIAELQRQVMVLNHFELLNYDETSRIVLGTVVCLVDSTSETQWLWLLPVSGGVLLRADEHEIRTITPEAPLGKKLLANDLTVGDEIELQLGYIKKQFEILELL
ncbi:MAG: hypothetical protein HRU08_07065 [Oleispira sp.]|nr:hypothetical protein [Oleispira sp.]